MDFITKTWETLKREERLLNERKKRIIIRESILGAFFLLVVLTETYLSHFSYAAVYNQNYDLKKFLPIPAVWNALDKLMASDTDNIILLSMGTAAGLAILGAFIAVILRLATKNVNAKYTSTCPAQQTAKQALAWAKDLDKRWDKSPKILLFVLIFSLVWIAAVTVVSTLLCKNGVADVDAISNIIFIGCQEAATYSAVLGILKLYVHTPIPDEQASHRLIREIEKHIEQTTKEKARLNKINKSIQFFLEGKYEEALNELKSFKDSKSGDISAIKILSTKELGSTIENRRKSYDLLWKAKDLGFVNDKIRQAVDLALNKLTPVVMKEAQGELFKIYQNFLDGSEGSMVYNCEKHVAYGHPDAIVMQIVGYINSEYTNNPKRYEGWLEKLKMAKRRGLSEETKDMADQLIDQLEEKIRFNKEFEEEEKRKQRENPFPASFYMPGPLSSWAEDSGWTDFRTGETLYRVEGRIVNGNGEEVSPAWWE